MYRTGVSTRAHLLRVVQKYRRAQMQMKDEESDINLKGHGTLYNRICTSQKLIVMNFVRDDHHNFQLSYLDLIFKIVFHKNHIHCKVENLF